MIQERVEKLLENTHPGAGGWKQVAYKYKMSKETRDFVEQRQDRGKCVIDYVKTIYPELTVYEFCKYLKDIKRNDITKALADHLISGSN